MIICCADGRQGFVLGCFHFFLDKKVEQKNQVPANAPPPGRPAHLWQVGWRSFVLGWWMSEAIDARLCCLICEDTGGAVFRPGFLKVNSVL